MSPRDPSLDLEDDQLVDVPSVDEAERAESRWLLARDDDPAVSPPSADIGRDYEEIENLLGNLPPRTADTRWHQEVLRLARKPVSARSPWWRRTTIRWALAGAFAAAAALLLIPRFGPFPELEVATWRAGEPRDLRGVAIGDRLVITARPREGTGDLRVYLPDGTLIAKCPHGPACSTFDDREVIDITLDKPVQYQVILVVMPTDSALELAGESIAAYLGVARAANARIILYPPIDVH